MSAILPPAYAGDEPSSIFSTDDLVKPGSRVPRVTDFRISAPDRTSTKGSLKLHVPAWGVALVRPLDPHYGPGTSPPPGEDTIVSGSLEVIMAERRRCRGISVAMQGTCKVWMGPTRGWEEDGIFEKVVEIGTGADEGIWLERGSQSFAFDIVLPSSLATHDYHKYGVLSYHLLAHVRGDPKPSSSFKSAIGLGGTKAGWLDGDLFFKRNMLVHAITDPAGVVQRLDLKRSGSVDGLGAWRFAAVTDAWSIAACFLFHLILPSPAPRTTIFLIRLSLVQSYTISSRRTPRDPPTTPEPTRSVPLYQSGRPHPPGEKFPDHTVDSLWRGSQAGGQGGEGCDVKAVIRLPTHETIRPSTHDGTITPIRVTHQLELQIFYSVEGERVDGTSCDGPGELRMMQVRTGIMVPSCCCTISSLDLPPYTQDDSEGLKEFDQLFQNPAAQLGCMCGSPLNELSEPLERRLREGIVTTEDDDGEARSGRVGQGWKYTDESGTIVSNGIA